MDHGPPGIGWPRGRRGTTEEHGGRNSRFPFFTVVISQPCQKKKAKRSKTMALAQEGGRRQRTEQDLRSLIGHTASEAVLGGVDVMTGQEYISTSMSDAKAPSWNSKSIPQ